MNKLNLLSKLAITAVAGVGATTMLGVTSAQAVEGGLGFSDNTNDFYFAPDTTDPVADFSVDFVTSTDDLVAVLVASGAFGDKFTPIETTMSSTPTGNFVDGTVLAILPNGLPEYEFTLENDLTFVLDTTDGSGDTATYMIGAGSVFLGEYAADGAGNPESLEFELETDIGSMLCLNEECWDVTGNAFEFEDLPGVGDGGEFLAQAEVVKTGVPEPASILGLLAVGGLGLSLKRKKQS